MECATLCLDLQYSPDEQLQGTPSDAEPVSEETEEEGQNGPDLDTVPEGMEQYQTIDVDDKLVAAVNGVRIDSS